MNLHDTIRRILMEETEGLGERTNLEKLIAKFVTNRLKSLNEIENFYDVIVDIYNGEYGKYCHITFLMKKPFSGDDSDLIHHIFKKVSIRKQIENLTGLEFNGAFSSSVSTVDNYKQTRGYYESQK